jgi:hypothetical protein
VTFWRSASGAPDVSTPRAERGAPLLPVVPKRKPVVVSPKSFTCRFSMLPVLSRKQAAM